MSRVVVVVDLETTALHPCSAGRAFLTRLPMGVVVEVAWWNLTTGENSTFVPAHHVEDVITLGDAKALEVNCYRDRLAHAEQSGRHSWASLHAQLDGATIAGSNPAFDAERWLTGVFDDLDLAPVDPWHHRLGDVAAYAGGRWGHPISELPGLRGVCERLGVDPPDHTAMGDVRAAGQALIALGAVTP